MEELLKDIENTIKVYERLAKFPASRTYQMIDRKGPIQALSELVSTPEVQKGFKVLIQNGLIDKSFESLVVKHEKHFHKEIVAAAKWKLENYSQLS